MPRSKIMTTCKYLCVFALLVASSGCYTVREDIDDCIMEKRLKYQARSAWSDAKSSCNDVEYRSHFQDGFEAGYLNVAQGGDGRPPILAPAKYRSWWYQNEVGNPEAMSWLDGYSYGAMNAEQNGVGQTQRVVTSLPPSAMHRGRGSQRALEAINPDQVLPPQPDASRGAVLTVPTFNR